MKWLVLVIALGAVLPVGLWLRGHPELRARCFLLVGLAPFFLSAIPGMDMAIVAWPDWLGFVHGYELTVLDLIVATLFVSLPRTPGSLPFKIVFLLYFLAVVLSMLQAHVPLAASFYAWQIARIFLVYATIQRACADERVPSYLLQGMAVGLCFQAGVAIWQRFGSGLVQSPGTFVHQNALGFASHFVIMPFFALLLAGARGWLAPATLLAGIVIAILTASRGAMGLSALGLCLVFVISVARGWTRRKGAVALAGMALAVAAAPLAIASFEKRFAAVPLSTNYDERAAFEKAAAMIVAKHPLGVGANHYVYVAKNRGYSERAGVIPIEASRNAHVHNAYWLAATETGYFGLVALVLVLLSPLITAFGSGWRARGDMRGDLLLGFGVALVVVCLHSLVEWILFTAQVQYFLAIAMGIVAGLAQQLGALGTSGQSSAPRLQAWRDGTGYRTPKTGE